MVHGPLRVASFLFVSFWVSFQPGILFAETLRLTEDRVIEIALGQGPSVQIARADRDIAETGIQGAKSVFDATVAGTVDHLVDKRDQAIPLFGTDNRTTNFNLGVSRAFPTGTRLGATWTNQRNSTNSAFAALNPYYESMVDVSLRQPVLRNVFGKQDRGGVTLAKKRFEAADLVSRRRVLENVHQILFDYWLWVTNRENAAVTAKSLERARRFESIAADKKIFGLYETTDVLAARANRMVMENEYTAAVKNRDDALGNLYRGLNLNPDDHVTSEESISIVSRSVGREAALETALTHRSDYAAAKAAVEARNIEVLLAKNRKWPQLDLLASLQLNGVDGAYGTAVDEIGGADHPAYFLGGEFSWPIENRLARSESRRAEHEKKKALYELKDAENRVVQDVEARLRDVEATRKQAQTSREIERVQKEKWELELQKYGVARSSSDLVVRFQEDYLNAQRNTLVALFRHRMAVLGLKLAQETLLP